jgi:hypothetical protein
MAINLRQRLAPSDTHKLGVVLFNLGSTASILRPISYDLTTIFENKITVGFFVGLLFILYKILQFVMIYEVVKSFRKICRHYPSLIFHNEIGILVYEILGL